MNTYNVSYYQCNKCGFIQTEEPYWLDEAYKRPINVCDTGIMQRNIGLSKQTSTIIRTAFNKDAHFLDYAGGYGIFVRLMRDIGYDFYWYDKYAQNLFATGFEYKNQKLELITAFEVFEHLVNPVEEIQDILNLSHGVSLLFSTNIYDIGLKVKGQDWWYYGFDHGQHISFYSMKTLEYMANAFKIHYYYINDGLHLFSNRKINVELIKFLFRIDSLKNRIAFKSKVKSRTHSDMIYTSKLDGE
jgi:hypothetical protein